MHLTGPLAVLAGLALATGRSSPYRPHWSLPSRQTTFDASTATLDEFMAYALETANARITSAGGTCTTENTIVRKEFTNLSGDERIAYTDALLCLIALPPKTPSDLAGAQSRFDDFVVTHINQTTTIHNTANFLGWHRFFLHEMEQALRNECGYTGGIPYWDWTKTAETGLAASEMVDGSATSLSGNGAVVEHNDTDTVDVFASDAVTRISLPLGTGGGCVTDGPFANLSVNLGPGVLILPDNSLDMSGQDFHYNPRCLKRDFTDEALTRYANETSVLNLLRGDTADIWAFQSLLQGRKDAGELGVHGGGHYSMGGDPGRDVFTTPAEPLFWSHHAGIDRVWWMWQMLDPATRAGNVSTAIRGALTLFTQEGNGTLTDLQNVGYANEGVEYELGQLLDNGAGPLCTVYE